MPCPFCSQPLADGDEESCPHCHTSLIPPRLLAYEGPLLAIEEIAQHASTGYLNVNTAQEIFAHLTGVVQQTLDLAREDIQLNLRQAQAAFDEIPEEARRDTLHYSKRFGEVQELLSNRLVELRGLWDNASIHANDRLPRLEVLLGQLRAELAELEDLARETRQPATMMVPLGPLPDEVGQALEHFSRTMDYFNLYCEGRQKSDLEPALVHLDEARRLLKISLMMDAYED